MKKIFNLLLAIIGFSSIGLGAAGIYTPAPGPLVLGDTYIQNQQFPMGPMLIQRGRIMQALLNDPELTNELAMLYVYTKTSSSASLPLYQNIVESLKTSLNNTASIATIEAFEKAIMKILHYEHYIYYSDGRWSSMFLTGFRKTWFSPSDWITMSTWLPSYTSPDISQLMREIKQLSQIAQRHSIALSLRLSNKADSYLYWKTRTLKTLAALGLATAYYYRDDIKNAAIEARPKITNVIKNFASNTYDTGANFASAAYNTGYNTAASLGNRALELGDAAYNTVENWGQYLRSYLPSYNK